jgi:aspartyl/asparaginyl-tRNA synthetase
MAIASGLERVFEVAPAFRAENSNTYRHATEFTSFDLEFAYPESIEDIMSFEEDLLIAGLTKVKEKFYHYTELTGTNVNVGKKIAKLFSDGTVTELECTVYMNVNDGKEDYSIEYPTVLNAGGISNY